MVVALAPVIAIDGTAGSGKGTVAAILARHLGFHLLESGRIYRAAGMMAMRIGAVDALSADNQNLSADNPQMQNIAESAARRLTDAIGKSGDKSLPQVFDELFDGEDLDGEQAGKAASMLASVGGARVALLPLQRAARRMPGLVAEGRDMGTVVFDDAVVKLYLDADIDIRAARRVKQLENRGVSATITDVRAGLAARDDKDKSRDCAPLCLASGAVVMDSAECSAEGIAQKTASLFFAAASSAGA